MTPSHGGWNISYAAEAAGWVFYALGFPSTLRNLGVCPDHQNVTLEGQPRLDVVVRAEQNGVYYTMREQGEDLGRITFPTNTLELQFDPGVEPSARQLAAARRIAVAYGFVEDGSES